MANYEVNKYFDILDIDSSGNTANFNSKGDVANSSETETVFFAIGVVAPSADDVRQTAINKGRIPPLGTLRITPTLNAESRITFITASANAILDFSAI